MSLVKPVRLLVALALAVSAFGSGCNALVGIKKAHLKEPTDCATTISLDDALVDGCVMRLGCDPYLPYNMSDCVGLSMQQLSEPEACTTNATSCADVEACQGTAFVPAEVCAGKVGWSCYGNIGTFCGTGEDTNQTYYQVDCSLQGVTCTAPDGDTTITWPCGPAGFTCASSTDFHVCEAGTVSVGCSDTTPTGFDCRIYGSEYECAEGDYGAFCREPSRDCEDLRTGNCDGRVLDFCGSDGQTGQYLCPEGTHCDLEAASGYCTTDDECDAPASCSEGCDDANTVRFCVAGVPFTIACDDYGFDGCIEVTMSEGVAARCSMQKGTVHATSQGF